MPYTGGIQGQTACLLLISQADVLQGVNAAHSASRLTHDLAAALSSILKQTKDLESAILPFDDVQSLRKTEAL
jgi:hypothetical protein